MINRFYPLSLTKSKQIEKVLTTELESYVKNTYVYNADKKNAMDILQEVILFLMSMLLINLLSLQTLKQQMLVI